MSVTIKKWNWEINGASDGLRLNVKELWSYRHLLISLIKRDFILNHQQTLLGPFWTLLQPLLTLVVYVVVFSRLVGISVGSIPPVLFYLSGIILWNFFSESFTNISNTFRNNIHIFNKVYFPRLIVPLSVMGTQLLRLGIQFILMLVLIIYFSQFNHFAFRFSWNLLALPLIVALLACISLGAGLLLSVISTKYRDLSNLISVVIRLMMFITPIIYPLSAVNEDLKWLVLINPLTPLFELFRYCLFGEGMVSVNHLIASIIFTFVIMISGLLLFNKKSSRLLDVA